MITGWEYLLLAALSLLAAIIDSSVGSGGLIRLPTLLALGLPPHLALGTNKFAATGASSVASVTYWQSDALDRPKAVVGFVLSFLGSILGVLVVTRVDASTLETLVPWVIGTLLLLTLLRPKLGLTHEPKRWTRARWVLLLGFALTMGFYDGFLGPGVGSMLIMGFMLFFGFGTRNAAAHARILNFASNLAAFLLFAAKGLVDWQVGAVMIVASLVGGRIGARITLRVSPQPLRWALIVATLAILLAQFLR